MQPVRGVRPGEPGWPDPAEWAKLRRRVGGRLVQVTSPFGACTPDPGGPGCTELFQNLGDPFYIGDRVALTQTLGWTDAWTSQASAYAVLAQHSADVAAAVNFARTHRVRLVVKGGGHSYLGGSNAPDSLLIWTRPNLRAIELHDRFVPRGAAGLVTPEPAVSVGAGAIWMDVYDCGHHHRGSLCAGRGLHHRRCPRPGAGRWVRQLLQGVRHRRREPAGGGGRHRRRGHPHRQPGPQPGPVLGPQGRRRRDLRCRHPDDAAHPCAAGLLRCGAGHDHRSVGRRLCDAGRPGALVLPREPAEPALGRGDPLWARTPDQLHHDVPGADCGPGRADLGAAVRLGHGPAGRLHPRGPAGAGAPGTGLLECRCARAESPA